MKDDVIPNSETVDNFDFLMVYSGEMIVELCNRSLTQTKLDKDKEERTSSPLLK